MSTTFFQIAAEGAAQNRNRIFTHIPLDGQQGEVYSSITYLIRGLINLCLPPQEQAQNRRIYDLCR